MIELMFKIVAVGVITAVLAALLRKYTSELSLLLVLSAGVLMLLMISDALMLVLGFFQELAQLVGIEEELLEPIAKTVALSVLTRLTVELCRGAGEPGLGSFVEICATILSICVLMPLLRAITVLMGEILG